jgi:acyl-coenzyme A thioesterase PaaI-like protein
VSERGAGKTVPDAPWRHPAPGQLIGPGHGAGDFLDAPKWRVLEERKDFLRLEIPMPPHVMNPRGQLFGGFAGTYVDLIALFTFRAGRRREGPWHWLATVSMHLDYYEPVLGPTFLVESEVRHRRGRNAWVLTRFLDGHGAPLIDATTVLREVA